MESIGEKLRLARERNNMTVEQVARETNVARRYLKALEDEDFDVFPGETYALGFLKNYGEFLGLNAEELVALYRTVKIQEQPLPMNELLEARPKGPPLRLVLLAAIILVALAGIGYGIFRLASRGSGAGPAAGGAAADFVFQEEVRTRWFTQGDGISVPWGGATYRIVVSSVGDALTLKVPGGTLDLGLGKERYVDLDGDSTPEIRIVWNDVDRAAPQKRVNLGLYKISAAAAAAASSGDTHADAVPVGSSTPPSRVDTFRSATLGQASAAGLFALQFTFRNDCFFRFLVDDNEREERFFQKGEQFTIDTARRQVTIWLSNAGAARMRVQGRDFELGGLGQVATRTIAWRKDTNAGGYVLEITPQY
jgi:cytoskeletal protein RodZ